MSEKSAKSAKSAEYSPKLNEAQSAPIVAVRPESEYMAGVPPEAGFAFWLGPSRARQMVAVADAAVAAALRDKAERALRRAAELKKAGWVPRHSQSEGKSWACVLVRPRQASLRVDMVEVESGAHVVMRDCLSLSRAEVAEFEAARAEARKRVA
jgi:hypothetical protein